MNRCKSFEKNSQVAMRFFDDRHFCFTKLGNRKAFLGEVTGNFRCIGRIYPRQHKHATRKGNEKWKRVFRPVFHVSKRKVKLRSKIRSSRGKSDKSAIVGVQFRTFWQAMRPLNIDT